MPMTAFRTGAGNSQALPRSARASSRIGRWVSTRRCSASSAFGRASFLSDTDIILGSATIRKLRLCWARDRDVPGAIVGLRDIQLSCAETTTRRAESEGQMRTSGTPSDRRGLLGRADEALIVQRKLRARKSANGNCTIIQMPTVIHTTMRPPGARTFVSLLRPVTIN